MKVQVTTPTNTEPQKVKVTIKQPNSATETIEIEIPNGTTAQVKRQLIAAALRDPDNPDPDNPHAAYTVVEGPITDMTDPDYPLADDEFRIKSLKDGTSVKFYSGKTGEGSGLRQGQERHGRRNLLLHGPVRPNRLRWVAGDRLRPAW